MPCTLRGYSASAGIACQTIAGWLRARTARAVRASRGVGAMKVAASSAGLARAPLPGGRLRKGGGAPSEFLPSLLVGDALALLDHEQIDQAGERIAQEPEVALPVTR